MAKPGYSYAFLLYSVEIDRAPRNGPVKGVCRIGLFVRRKLIKHLFLLASLIMSPT